MEIAIAITGLLISAGGGAAGGVVALLRLSTHLDKRFDATDQSLQALTHRYDVQRATDLARIEMLEYRINQAVQLTEHKSKRLENGLLQMSEYLRKNHSYSPRSTFPLERPDRD